jgi:hypothetical protein
MDVLLSTLDADKAAIVRQYVQGLAGERRTSTPGGVSNRRAEDPLYSSSDSADSLERQRPDAADPRRPRDLVSQQRVAAETASVDFLLEQAEHVLTQSQVNPARHSAQQSPAHNKMSLSPAGLEGGIREDGSFVDLPRRLDEDEDVSARKKKSSKLKTRKSAPGAVPSFALSTNFSPVSALSTPPPHKAALHSQSERGLRSHRNDPKGFSYVTSYAQQRRDNEHLRRSLEHSQAQLQEKEADERLLSEEVRELQGIVKTQRDQLRAQKRELQEISFKEQQLGGAVEQLSRSNSSIPCPLTLLPAPPF